MKNTIKILLVALAAMLVLIMICSCQVNIDDLPQEERAMAVIERAGNNLNNSGSYEATAEFILSVYDKTYLGARVDAKEQIWGRGTSDYKYAESSTITVTVGTVVETIDSTIGYSNGAMYMSNTKDDITDSYYTEMSTDDFLHYLDEINKSEEISDEGTAEKITCTKNSKGEYTVKISQLSEKAIEEFMGSLDSLYRMIPTNYYINDIQFTFKTDSELYPKRLNVVFEIFDSETNEQPSFTSMEFTITYADINALKEPDSIDYDDYKRVDDVRALGYINEYRGKLEEGKETISFETNTAFVASFASETNKQQYKYVGTAGVDEDGKYFYDYYDASNSGKHYIYRDGKAYNAPSGVSLDSDREAREYFNQSGLLFVAPSVDINGIENMKINGDEYKLIYDNPDISAYAEMISSIRGEVLSKTATITITVDDEGRITETEYTLYISVSSDYGNLLIQGQADSELSYEEEE
ncbi:MAG: hypothetical protein IJ309_06205 [Clostridia bacterium]|nr:hypothetical protein [Clostridia bacterium]